MRPVPLVLGFLFLALLALSAAGWGSFSLKFLKLGRKNCLENLLFELLTGLGVMGLALLLLGLLGFFNSLFIWTIFVIGIFFFLGSLALYRQAAMPSFRMRQGDWFSLCFLVLSVSVLIVTLLRLNVPVVSTDEMSYHLYLPKMFLLKHSIFFWATHVNSAFPQLGELLYAFGITLRHPMAVKGVHFLFALLMALAVFIFSRRLLPNYPAWQSALLFLTLPVVNHQMALANNDLALSAFLLGAYLAIFRWVEEPEKKWIVLAGILSGLAMGVKYLALFGIATQSILILAGAGRRKTNWKETFSDLILFVFVCLMVSGVWYLRSYLATGNPIYPYLTNWLGGEGLENPLHLGEKGFGKGMLALLLCPWHATMSPASFGGTANQFGPVFLAYLPGILLFFRKTKLWRTLYGATGLMFLFWFYSKQNLRFLIPALPFLCLMVIAAHEDFLSISGRWKAIPKLILLVWLSLHLGIALFQFRNDWQAALGLEKSSHYLTRRVAVYPVAEFINQSRPGGNYKILSQEHRGYYFDGWVVRERAYRRLSGYPEEYQHRMKEFYQRLKSEGFTHLLIKRDSFTEKVPFLERFVSAGAGSKHWLRPVYQHNFKDAETGKRCDYGLYELIS